MAEDLPQPVVKARARFQAERAKAELWYNEAVKKDKTVEDLVETLIDYAFRVFFRLATEIYNTGLEMGWNAQGVRERIETSLDNVINHAFHSKHYYREAEGSDLWRAGFRVRASDAIRSSAQWRVIQENLQALAEWEADPTEPGTDVSNSTEPPPVAAKNRKEPISLFPKRASWLKERLLERGWSNSDPAKYRGPDRKTIEKILRGEAVRNDVLEKLADALSGKHSTISVLNVPRD
jgi:hypothetical protein